MFKYLKYLKKLFSKAFQSQTNLWIKFRLILPSLVDFGRSTRKKVVMYTWKDDIRFQSHINFPEHKARPFLFVEFRYIKWNFSDRRSQKKKDMVNQIILYRNFPNLGNICKWPVFDKLNQKHFINTDVKNLTNWQQNILSGEQKYAYIWTFSPNLSPICLTNLS